MKKIISSVLALVMVAGLFALMPMPATAADTAQSTTEVGKVETEYKPAGTAITTAADFKAMEAGGNYYLAADIEISESYTTAFTGTFDGNGHTVTVSAPLFEKLIGAIGKTEGKHCSECGEVLVAQKPIGKLTKPTDTDKPTDTNRPTDTDGSTDTDKPDESTTDTAGEGESCTSCSGSVTGIALLALIIGFTGFIIVRKKY